MNFLQVLTTPENGTSNFIVHWTNTTQCMRGTIRVKVPDSYSDRKIIAELYALQYLLEVEEAIGVNAAGNEYTELIVSLGALKKLSRKNSDKPLAAYAKFLVTRFKGSPITVEKQKCDWVDASVPPTITLDASLPMDEKLNVYGVGEVILTSHVVEQYHDRFKLADFRDSLAAVTKKELEVAAHENVQHADVIGKFGIPIEPSHSDAWRDLRKIAADSKVQEFEKSSTKIRMKYAVKGMEEGRYFYYQPRDLVMVIGKNHKGQLTLLTVYRKGAV